MTETRTNFLGTAIRIAAEVHEQQRDKGGKAYILHPLRIMMRLRSDDEELLQIAVMHDVIEDSDYTVDVLRDRGFSERVCAALTLLTHAKYEPYESYIKKIASNRDAIRVKLEDLKDNSDLSRLKGVSEKDHKRHIKYNNAYMYLSSVLASMDKVSY
jgi:(p)ppGpp synthase/HD superfamily hydrolase